MKTKAEIFTEASKIISNAIEAIKQMNYNGYQINSSNDAIISCGQSALSRNDENMKKIAIGLISRNENGFKINSYSEPETIHSIQAKKWIKNNQEFRKLMMIYTLKML